MHIWRWFKWNCKVMRETESPWPEHLLPLNYWDWNTSNWIVDQNGRTGIPKQPKLLWNGRFLSKNYQQNPMERLHIHNFKDWGPEFVPILNFHPYIFGAGRYSTCSQMRKKNTKPNPKTLSTMVSNLQDMWYVFWKYLFWGFSTDTINQIQLN